MKRRELNTLLGLGALLSPLVSEHVTKVQLKKNIVLISSNFGFLKERFQASTDALNSPYLNFYEKVKNKCTVFKGIEQKKMGGGHRSHHSIFTAQSKYLTIKPPFVSLDQLIASRVHQTTRHKFLALSTGRSRETCWSLSGQHILPLQSYEEAFYKVFKHKIDTTHLIQQQDFLNDFQASPFSNSSHTNYQTAIREMTNEMDNNIYWSKQKLPNLKSSFNSHKNEFMNLEGYLDLITQAIEHDQCRIFNFNISNFGTLDIEGVKEGYHTLTHNGSKPEMKRQLIQVEEFQLHYLSKFIEHLENKKLLDQTIVLITGAFGDSNSHSTKDLPLLVFGGGIKHRGLVQCKKSSGEQIYNLSDLYVNLLHHVGLDSIQRFAGYDGRMTKDFI